MKISVTALFVLLTILQGAAQLPEPEIIMDKSRELSIAGTISANITLTITEKNGSTRNRTFAMSTKSFPEDVGKRYIKFLSPPDVKGTAMLIIDNLKTADEMWIYLPALKKTRRIVSSEKGKSFMNSEFTNADMSSPPVSDFVHKHTTQSGSNNQFVIESIPVDEDKADEYGYSKKVSYIDKVNYQVQKMEIYNFENVIYKIIEIKGIHNLPEGKFIVSDMLSSNLRTNRKSEIKMTNIAEGAKVDDSVFSIQNLER
ncbi:MAG TPA: outer membrane lipoprotein-sorting protein [Bacteroidales bacterium]|nr:outer membrane lipoprotein-sorting protein [Bacteroidales bacterium]